MSIYNFEIPVSIHQPAQRVVLNHIWDFFTDEGVKKLDLIDWGLRLTDKTGAVADFIYNHDTGRVDMIERDEKYLAQEARRKKNVMKVQRDLLKSMK